MIILFYEVVLLFSLQSEIEFSILLTLIYAYLGQLFPTHDSIAFVYCVVDKAKLDCGRGREN